jgi:soluble lytic murein transglycosylase-like protein
MLNRIIFIIVGAFILMDVFGNARNSEATLVTNAQLDRLITDKAREYGFNPSLIHALVEVESGKKADIISNKGAIGLMQVVPRWHLKSCGLKSAKELMTPFKNLDCGLGYLRSNVDKYGLFNGLKAYNGGARCLKRNCGKENLEYPHKILNKLA